MRALGGFMSHPSPLKKLTQTNAIAIAALVSMLAAPTRLAAQQTSPPAQAPVQTGAGKQEPERGFVKALVFNLGDDLKHIPRKNSLYWVGAGAALALAVHPADDDLNARLAGSGFADKVFKPGKYVGSFPF